MSKNVNIKINADSKNAQSGLKKVSKEITGLGNSIKKSTPVEFAKSFVFLSSALKTTTSGIKATINTVLELNNAYLAQAKAEKQLETSAKNNPYLNRQSVRSLQDFASSMQKVTTVGDEQLLPLMSQLASAGRTQAEIQDIITASLDVSASGAMSLESAVKNLNKTYGGLAGELGESIPAIKTLTKEQLQNGEAVKLVASQYKGMAQETANATGSGEQLKNAIGDLKEELGYSFNKAITPVQNFFKKIVEGFTNTLNEKRKFAEEMKNLDKVLNSKGNDVTTEERQDAVSTLRKQRDEKQAQIKEKQSQIEQWEKNQTDETININIRNAQKGAIESAKKALKSLNSELTEIFINLAREEEKLAKNLDDDKRNQAFKKQIADKKEEARLEQERLEKIQKYKDIYDKTVQQAKDDLQLRKDIGQEISRTEELTTLLTTEENALITLLTQSEGLIDFNDGKIQNSILPIIEEQKKELEELSQEVATSMDTNISEDLIKKWTTETKTQLQELEYEFEQLNSLKNTFVEQDDIDKISLAIANCQKAIDELNFEKMKENIRSVADNIVKVLGDLQGHINQISETALSANQRRTDKEIDDLEYQHERGLISFEKFEKEKEKIEKKSAQEEYKIKMAQWSMNLAMATAQSAQAFVNALTTGTYPANVINAVTTGIIGASQVAVVASSKPSPPRFASGGFLTGTATHGDKIPFMGNAGEAILNPAETRLGE